VPNSNESKADIGQEVEQACGKFMVIGKNLLWNLKLHLIRNHNEVMRKIVEVEEQNMRAERERVENQVSGNGAGMER